MFVSAFSHFLAMFTRTVDNEGQSKNWDSDSSGPSQVLHSAFWVHDKTVTEIPDFECVMSHSY